MRTPPPATTGASVTNVFKGDGLSLDYFCAASGTSCQLDAAGPAGNAAEITWQASGGAGGGSSGAQAQLGPYQSITSTAIQASPSGVILAPITNTNAGMIVFSYATQAGKVVTGTLSLSLGATFDTNSANTTGYVSGTITAN
ncbi:MAG: hypothetical protein ACYDHH_28975 [Solirubrobacteraceae bacterium]